jgi:hypothetical protein
MSNSEEPDRKNVAGDDEDLFDFPPIELTLDGLRDGSIAGSMPADPAAARILASVPSALPTEPVVALRGQSPSTLFTPDPLAFKNVTPAAGNSPGVPITSPPADVPGLNRTRPLALVAVLFVLFALNGAGFWYLWRTRVSFGAGIEDLRSELDDASKRLERARREAAAQASSALQTREEVELARVNALERSSIVMAENEIHGGDYGAARRRLNQLLAQAERMSPGMRAEIEPRATYLIAKSYLDEARARKGGKQ